MHEGSIKMNPDDKNLTGNWNGFDLVQQSLASFFKDGDKPSAPLKHGICIIAM
jgi:hypothetical protein